MKICKAHVAPVIALTTLLLAGCSVPSAPPAAVPHAVGTATSQAADEREQTPPTREAQQAPAEAAAINKTLTPTAISTALPSAATPAASDRASAPNADVLFVTASQQSGDTWQFAVTIEHPDTGWEDYADGWDVVLADGTVAKPDPDSPFTRLLLHPHETEQPFTRSQGGIIVPPDSPLVTVRAHDMVDGFGGREVTVDLTGAGGPDYEVRRQ